MVLVRFNHFLTLCIIFIICTFSGDGFARVRTNLNGLPWKFYKGEQADAKNVSFNDGSWLSITLPHDFNGGVDGKNFDVFKGRFKNNERNMYKGPTWYRTSFNVDQQYTGKRICIEFEAASLAADVYVNGNSVGQHKGGYTAFKFDITDKVKVGAKNVLAVRVDNSNNPDIAPWMNDEKKVFPNSFDYAVYGGIYRDVWLEITDNVKIEAVYNTAEASEASPAFVTIKSLVKNYTNELKKVKISHTIKNPEGTVVGPFIETSDIAAGKKVTVSQDISQLGKIMLWSPDKPNIYHVNTTISIDTLNVDTYESVFGIRYYLLTKGSTFRLNNKDLMIRGVNRHQDMQGRGYALTNEQHIKDAVLIKEAGFNMVRHAHYPCDREFARACDSLGLMLWLEIPYSASTSNTTGFKETCKSQIKEMIESFYNNPSVILWGLGNENDRSGAPDNELEQNSNALFKELNSHTKSLDNKRLTTVCNVKYPSNQKLVDIYAPQNWSGWYVGVIMDYQANTIIGEYGADMHYTMHSEEKFDGSYGDGNNTRAYWCQEFGCVLHEYVASWGMANSSKFPGHLAWVAFDFASPRGDRNSNPIPFMNQKGLILHDHKTKKDVYYFYQSFYRQPDDYPMVYIVSKSWTDRWKSAGSKRIWAYSNCDSVVLYNNYGKKSLGTRKRNAGPRGDTRFEWDNAYVENNVLYAEGYYKGNVAARDTLILENLKKVSIGNDNNTGKKQFTRLSAVELMRNPQSQRDQYQKLSLFNSRGQLVANLLKEPAGIEKTLSRGMYIMQCVTNEMDCMRYRFLKY